MAWTATILNHILNQPVTATQGLLWPGQQPYLLLFSISQSQPHKVCYGLDSNHTYSYSQSASHSHTRFAMPWTATILTLILNQPVTASQGLLWPGQQPYLLLFSISQSRSHKEICLFFLSLKFTFKIYMAQDVENI